MTLPISEIRNQLKTGQMSLEEWAKSIFQKHWDAKSKEIGKQHGIQTVHIYKHNPDWSFDEAKRRARQIFDLIIKDTVFIDSITHPYGITWRIDRPNTNTLDFYLEDGGL